ncbi:uncharacterized protein LOC115225210 [Octopus sinensis]|uniref:Uncharacterized protein LOC115225210 n=1 Tax=Octopus sinensis TaxID=2607531 RepID=A0A6P7TJI6_9MOLL|nr:uncharacterized protein LOC115225210 [Octopus sinensis]
MTPRKAEEDFKIPKSVLHRHIKLGKNIKKHGGQTVLFSGEEKILVQRLVLCASWGYPMDSYDVRLIVKGYMDRRGVDVKRFKGNMPGVDWAESFLMRHKDNLRERISQNINRAQATVSQPTINSYFNNLAESLDGTHAPNIVNYDETNLTDDPGRKEVITKRGTKYPEISTSKVSTSLIYAAAADGILIPPYIVYKAVNLYDTWTFGGPNGARYNRSKSGWFDLQSFSDWFTTIALPYLKKLAGKQVLIGDTLNSHLSLEVIKTCKENDISFIFLPLNSTQLF